MTCDHAANVNCNAKTEQDQVKNTAPLDDNRIEKEGSHSTNEFLEGNNDSEMSSEKIVIIILLPLILGLSIALSWFFRSKLIAVVEPYIEKYNF